jgi:O-antigen/teichoic acid export membrane protein
MTDVLSFGLRRNDLPEYRRFAAGVGLRVMGVIASLASVVITSRGLGVEGRGLLYTCTSAASVAGVVLALGMNSAVILVVAPRPELGRRAIRRALLAASGAGLAALLMGLGFGFIAPEWLPPIVIELSPVVAGMVATQVFLWWCSSLTQALGAVDRLPLIEFLYRSGTVVWGWVALFYLKVSIVQFLASLVALDALYGALWMLYVRALTPPSRSVLPWPREWRHWSLKAYLPYALHTGMRRVDALILTSLAGARTTGLYSIAIQTLDLCQIAPVFLGQKAMFAFSAGHGDSPSMRWLRRMLPLSTIATMILAGLTADIWAGLFFGREFSTVGPIILALSIGGGALAWQTVAVQEINAMGFPIRLTFAWLASFCTMIVLFFAVVPYYGAVGAATGFSSSYVLLAVFIYQLRSRMRKIKMHRQPNEEKT